MVKLGVNIDHVATVRQARRGNFPDPLAAARLAIKGGATGITAHLREDRRHIQEEDIIRLKRSLSVPLNMEMAINPNVMKVALRVKPEWVCLVPEKRQELTTEGGLHVAKFFAALHRAVLQFHKKKIKVSLFVEPDMKAMYQARLVGADAVELHTGLYARLRPPTAGERGRIPAAEELNKITRAAKIARGLGLTVNAGHGLNYENVGPLLRAFPFNELNIGFSIIARSFVVGLERAVREMKSAMRIK